MGELYLGHGIGMLLREAPSSPHVRTMSYTIPRKNRQGLEKLSVGL